MKRVFTWLVVVLGTIAILITLRTPVPWRNATLRQPGNRLTNVPAVILGTPRLLEKPRIVSFDQINVPTFLSQEDIRAIAIQVGRVHTAGDQVSRLEACWDDMVVAARATIGKSIVYLIKDTSDGWRVMTVLDLRY